VLADPKVLASLSTAFLSDHHSAIEAATSAETSRRREREQRAFGPLDTKGDAHVKIDEANSSSLRAPAGAEVGVYAMGHGQCVSAAVRVGDLVRAGAPLLAMSAMKMEHVVRAPVSAKVISLLAPGDRASADGLVAVLVPSAPCGAGADADLADLVAMGQDTPGGAIGDGEEGWGREIETMAKMWCAAQELGGAKGVARQRAQGKKTARERIDMVSSCTIISLVYVLYVGGGGRGGRGRGLLCCPFS
jgi:biotin carboxyl carrier protein